MGLGGEERESGEQVEGRTWICGVQRNDHVLVRPWMGGLCVVPGAWVRATMDNAELSSRLQSPPAQLFKHGLGILRVCVALAA